MRPSLPFPLRSILFVCHGNIIRSALAELFFRQQAQDTEIQIASAGVRAQSGRGADPRAETAAQSYGLSLDGHRARPVTPELLSACDVLFLMDESNENLLLESHPSTGSKIRYLGDWNPQNRAGIIADPYTGSLDDVRHCAREIHLCTAALAGFLQQMPANATGQAKTYRD